MIHMVLLALSAFFHSPNHQSSVIQGLMKSYTFISIHLADMYLMSVIQYKRRSPRPLGTQATQCP